MATIISKIESVLLLIEAFNLKALMAEVDGPQTKAKAKAKAKSATTSSSQSMLATPVGKDPKGSSQLGLN